ncbi:hypothetical protein CHS0354_039235 [Potamilus streckersoni]|uniref:Alanine racemase C-terminal domain-containing protein n=1 Tax=Potamilus streckersoni TaxID=2493646 RepID=A0AAE0TDH2_9BIVA|nr:hypothetical protein CHS0354_039235 [Potamilus streckersoni]
MTAELNGNKMDARPNFDKEFSFAKRTTCLRINLDTILSNIGILKAQCSNHTDVIAVIKANAYGHGSVEVARYLSRHGIHHFAVAAPSEGKVLRQAGVTDFIQVFGNANEVEIPDLLENKLVPTVATIEFLQLWAEKLRLNKENNGLISNDGSNVHTHVGSVVIKVDSGMSRNGCQPEDLVSLIKFCLGNGVHVHSIMTHFSQAWDDPDFTKIQLETFLKAASPYRKHGIKLHTANSAGIIQGFGVDLDFIRPGIAIYGQPLDNMPSTIAQYEELGLRPAMAWLARPTLIKTVGPGQVVGYDQTYKCKEEEIVATFPVGYADGYNRLLSGKGLITTIYGTPCPVIGRVSMDAITVKLHKDTACQDYYILQDDFTSANSTTQMANELKTITYEVCTSLSQRLPRLYIGDGKLYTERTNSL